MHLKAIQQMAKVPRSIGVPPLSDSSFEQALAMQAQTNNNLAAIGPSGGGPGTPGGSDDEGKINPLAGMGLTDEQYNMILQNLVNGEPFIVNESLSARDPGAGSSKRAMEETSDQDRSRKRGRFEVVE
jgi:osomolarity two-component system, response regulator SKN7